MSQLKVFQPADSAEPRKLRVDAAHRDILPFRPHFAASGSRGRALDRAKLLHEHRRCPCCERPLVEPIETDDAAVGRGSLAIPGTATIVGFFCQSCFTEWPV